MSLNLSDAPEQRTFETIPDGTFAHVGIRFKAGGYNQPGADEIDSGLFKAAKSTDGLMLEVECTVLDGANAHRKWTEYWMVAGGALDEKGNSKGWLMTKPRLRAILDSRLGLDPKSVKPEDMAQRKLRGFKDLDGIDFWAKIGVQPAEPYVDEATGVQKAGFDKNFIDRIVVPGDEEYAPLRNGDAVAPKPRAAKHTAQAALPVGGAGVAAKPSWQQGDAAPAAGATAAQPAPQAASAKPSWLKG